MQGAISRRQAGAGAIGGKQQTPRLGNQYEAGAASRRMCARLNARCPTRSAPSYGEAGEIGLSFRAMPFRCCASASIRIWRRQRWTCRKRRRRLRCALGRSSMISRTHRLSRPRTGRAWQERRNRPCSRDIDLRRLETVRKRLNSVYRGAKNSPEDARGVRQIIKALDGWIDDAIDSRPASGRSDGHQDTERGSRAADRYGQLFEPQTYDGDAGRVMQKIVNTDATPNEVVNLLFGYGEFGQTPVSVRVAKRMRDIIWEIRLRVGAIPRGGIHAVDWWPSGAGRQGDDHLRINRALDGQGMSLTREIFTPEEITRIKALRTAIERTVTPKSVGNPSKTGYEVARLLEDALSKVGGIAGLLKGDVTGAAATLGIKGRKTRRRP